MKIGLIGYEANVKNRVGSNRYAFELIKALYRLDQKNNYLVYLPEVPLSDLPIPRANWQYRVVGPKKMWNFWALPRALFKEKPKLDLVFNPGHYAPLLTPCPLVISVMDLGFLRFPGQFTRKIYWQLKYWTEWSAKKAKHIFAISQATKKDLIKFYKLPENKITVTYPGINKSTVEIKKIKEKFIIKNDYILFLGTLKPNKNIEGLIRAFKILVDEETKLDLVVAGRKGWLFESIYRLVVELGLEERVVFTDFVPDEEVPMLMTGARALVTPSFWEGFGIPVVEAMNLGVPVVVSDRGSLSEVVGPAGVVVDPTKPAAIARGIKIAIENRDKLRESGKEQAKKFSWEVCAQQTLAKLNALF
ncbi:MAG: glycosyltransferase family 1 protein [Candidatus Shapirobacteria bacterium]